MNKALPGVMSVGSIIDLIREGSGAGPKVSIYLSVPQTLDYARYGKAELKTRRRQIIRRIELSGTPPAITRAIERTLDELVDSESLWSTRMDGYAIFASTKGVRYYGLPVVVHHIAAVGNNYYIRPLIRLLSLPESFYVLEVKTSGVRLLRVHPNLVIEVPVDSSGHLRSLLGEQTPIRGWNFHTIPNLGRNGSIVPHGSGRDTKHLEIRRSMRAYAEVVNQLLQGERIPLILHGTEDVRNYFRKYLTYPHILTHAHNLQLQESSYGPAHRTSDLWQQCAKILFDVEQYLSSEELIARFYSMESVQRASHDIGEISRLSREGHVEELLVGDSVAEGDLTAEQFAINDAISATLAHGGSVAEVTRPGQFDYLMGAILRPGILPVEPDAVPVIGSLVSS